MGLPPEINVLHLGLFEGSYQWNPRHIMCVEGLAKTDSHRHFGLAVPAGGALLKKYATKTWTG